MVAELSWLCMQRRAAAATLRRERSHRGNEVVVRGEASVSPVRLPTSAATNVSWSSTSKHSQ